MDAEALKYLSCTADDIKAAETAGFEIVYPEPNQLLLDLDSEAALAIYTEMLPIAQSFYGAFELMRWKSKSGNWHVVLDTDEELTPLGRIALQACLGSDNKRELLAVARQMRGDECLSVLFKPPQPTEKAEEVETAIAGVLGVDRRDAVSKMQCQPAPIGCGKPITKFRDKLSEKEYRISGLCQKCQDSVFGE